MKNSLASILLLGSILPLCAAHSQTRDTSRKETIHPISEVVVTGTRSETDPRHLPMTISVVDRAKIENGYEPSLLPTLTEQVPGLFATGRGIMGYGVSGGAAGQMTLRGVGGTPTGGPTTGLLVLIDGHPQYMGLMGHPIADAYQSMLAEKVEVVRGPASVLYGSNAMGGVINIVTRRMPRDGVRTTLHAGYGSYNTLETEVTNQVQAGRFTSTVTGSYNRTDGHRKDMGFEQYGGYAKLGYRISRAWDAYADVNLTHFNASNPGSLTAPLVDNDQRITRGMTSVALRNDYGRTSGALSFFYNWGRHKIDDGYSPGGEPLDYRFNSRDRMLGLSWYQSVQLFPGNRLTVGLDYQRFGGKAWNRYTDGKPDKTTADKTIQEVAGYVDFRQSLTRWLILDAGLRLDHHSEAGTEWVPQGGLSLLLPRNAQLKAMVSKGFRFPTIREMYMFPPQNPDLKPEKLMNYELSFTQRSPGGGFSYGASIFYIDGDNMIQAIPVDGKMKNVNTGRIENWGVEADLSARLSKAWTLTANYSYLHMKFPVVAAPEHKLWVGATYVRGRWNVSTGVQYIRNLITQKKPELRDSFVLWNANLSFRLNRWLDLFVRGENLLAQRYEINAGYPMPRATALGGLNIHF
ncbi:TonB-dependent receptor plug domain-containing protein [Alistipes sp.]|uniref:TonB-dependent receptor plug domain-containing protein n=1 Tax=Alistipes sp. TaxID=1872444 RepID=UPI003AEF4F9A